MTRTPAAAEATLFLTAITVAGALGAIVGAIVERRLRRCCDSSSGWS